jgi:glycosyltransferase involved in cell wall biosynthesis
MKRIAIVTGFSLARNPRVMKEAMTLSRAGHEVIVLGGELDEGGFERDQAIAHSRGFVFKSVGSLRTSQATGRARSWLRLRRRFGHTLFRATRIPSRYQLGYFAPELLRQARDAEADYYILHLEQALWVGAKLLEAGRRVGIDMEDWFSEDSIPETRRQQPRRLLRSLEEFLLHKASHSTTTSQAMSDALAKEFDCPRPTVVYNAFAWADRDSIDGLLMDRQNAELPSIHWYSQTLGERRGLEDLVAALPYLKHPAEIHLRGKSVSGFGDWLMNQIPAAWHTRIFIHEEVPNHELLSRIAEHDIGFAGEMKYCRNKELTVSNKILHYLLAGLAVVASDTIGQREVARRADGAVKLYSSGNALALAEQLNSLLDSATELRSAKAAAVRAAQAEFSWEKQEDKLLTVVEGALGCNLSAAAANSRLIPCSGL